jgi:hypothetical protein
MALELKGTQNKLVAVEKADVTVGNTDVETGGNPYTVGAGQLTVGKQLRVKGAIRLTTKATPGTLQITLKAGATDVVASSAFTAADSLSGAGVMFEFVVDVVTATTVKGYLKLFADESATGVGEVVAPAAAVTIVPGTATAWDVTYDWQTADAANIVLQKNISWEIL